jgi:osmotically-inducible protein OsmY
VPRDHLVVTRRLLGTAAVVIIATIPSSVSASDDEVRRSGSCSAKASWEMRAKWDDDERIELRGRVEDTRSGQTWAWKIKHNGSVSARGRAVTGSSGFEVRRALVDLPGVDHCVFRAKRVSTGEVCRGRIDW